MNGGLHDGTVAVSTVCASSDHNVPHYVLERGQEAVALAVTVS
jgi:hypothetical protein